VVGLRNIRRMLFFLLHVELNAVTALHVLL